MSEPVAPEAPKPQESHYGRGSAGDMVRSVLVILVPIVLIAWFFTRPAPPEEAVRPVSWVPVATLARQQAHYPILVPRDLGEGWTPTQVQWVQRGNPGLNGDISPRDEFKLGFLDPHRIYVELREGDVRGEDLVQRAVGKGRAEGDRTVDGRRWERLAGDNGRTRALVWRDSAVTAVVSGDTDFAGLEAFVEHLTDS